MLVPCSLLWYVWLMEVLTTWACIICFFVFTLFFLQLLVELDRYMHIRYPNTYHEQFSNRRFNIAIAMIFRICIIELFLHYLSVYMWCQYPVFTIPFSLGLISIAAELQIKSVFLLKEHSCDTEHLTPSSKKIMKLAKGYVLPYLISMANGKLFKAVCSHFTKRINRKINDQLHSPTCYTWHIFAQRSSRNSFLRKQNQKSSIFEKQIPRCRTNTKRLGISMANIFNTRVPNLPNKCSPKLHVQWKFILKQKLFKITGGIFFCFLICKTILEILGKECIFCFNIFKRDRKWNSWWKTC